MEFLLLSLFVIFTLQVASTFKPPLECQVTSDCGYGTIGSTCDFKDTISFEKDTKAIIAYSASCFGQPATRDGVHTIRFERSVFNQIPSAIFSTFGSNYQGVQNVRFNTGKLYSINSKSFKYADNLEYIEIFNTKIEEITSRAFEGATNLKEISLRQCEIRNFASDAFHGLPNLKKINVKGSTYDNKDFLNSLPHSVENVELVY